MPFRIILGQQSTRELCFWPIFDVHVIANICDLKKMCFRQIYGPRAADLFYLWLQNTFSFIIMPWNIQIMPHISTRKHFSDSEHNLGHNISRQTLGNGRKYNFSSFGNPRISWTFADMRKCFHTVVT